MKKGHIPHSLECFPYYVGSRNSFIHYTCNAPPIETLERNNIFPLGNSFGCANNSEVLEISLKTYEKFGFNCKPENIKREILTLNLEKLMRDLK